MTDWRDTLGGLVYSTKPDAINTSQEDEEISNIEPQKQRVHLRMERKGRGGKTVTIISGFVGSERALNELASRLKQRCGVGGAVKDGEIVIQGDRREQIRSLLQAEGMTVRG